MFTILVADDERSMTEFLEIMLIREGYEVVLASSAEEAMARLDEGGIDLVVTDINMPKAGGLAVIEKAKQIDSALPVIMITAFASSETAVEAMKLGALDYITKPFQNEEIKVIIQKGLERRVDKVKIKQLTEEVAESYQLCDLLGSTPAMQSLFKMIRKVADSNSTVLITGESGVGKELVAKAIHYLSGKRERPFYCINCGAMPEQLLESELFGHQKGAFTGASSDKKGLMEMANGGSFFLDEIGEAPLSVQVKLLRVLQEREIRRVGGVRDIPVDIRVIAATNVDLKKAIAEGRFREDLYYRLNIIPITIPPLRERRGDIPMLVSRFIEKYATQNRSPVTSLSAGVMTLLERYQWPGNVRELENVIERAVVLTTGTAIEEESLPDTLRKGASISSQEAEEIPDGGVDLEALVDRLERNMLDQALRKAGGVKKEAAKLLKLSFRSFRYKLGKYNMGRGGKKDDSN